MEFSAMRTSYVLLWWSRARASFGRSNLFTLFSRWWIVTTLHLTVIPISTCAFASTSRISEHAKYDHHEQEEDQYFIVVHFFPSCMYAIRLRAVKAIKNIATVMTGLAASKLIRHIIAACRVVAIAQVSMM